MRLLLFLAVLILPGPALADDDVDWDAPGGAGPEAEDRSTDPAPKTLAAFLELGLGPGATLAWTVPVGTDLAPPGGGLALFARPPRARVPAEFSQIGEHEVRVRALVGPDGKILPRKDARCTPPADAKRATLRWYPKLCVVALKAPWALQDQAVVAMAHALMHPWVVDGEPVAYWAWARLTYLVVPAR